MTEPRRQVIVVVRCRECGIEMVGRLRDGMVYATNRGRPADAREIEGYCFAHAKVVTV